MRRPLAWTFLAAAAVTASATVDGAPSQEPLAPKVLVITASTAEAAPWIAALGLTQSIPIAGGFPGDPAVHCNADGVCLVTTGVGKANAAASVAAVVFGGALDLSHTYFLLSSLAAIHPAKGTLGSIAWASSVVDGAIAWEIDARSLPSGWTTGYLGIDATSPTDVPLGLFGTESYKLSPALAAKAAGLSTSASLTDDGSAASCRSGYSGPASLAPSVVQCDALTTDTAWQGALLGAHATAWTALVTGTPDTYCARQPQDNAVMAALSRGSSAGLLDATRIAVVHGASSFDRPPTGQSAFDALEACGSAGVQSATANLGLAGKAVVDAIVSDWADWQSGVPQ